MAKVSDILVKKGRKVLTSTVSATVLDATHEMNKQRVGALLVMDEGRVVGMFTERDVLTRVVGAEMDPKTAHLFEVMTTPVAYCTPDTTLEDCKAIFTEKRIRHLPVMNGDELVGLVTSGDVVAFEADDHKQTIQYLEEYIQS